MNNAILYAGKNITQANDPLNKVSVEYLYHAIKNPKPELQAQIRQLRIIRDVDVQRYSACKRTLPYIVCATFNPAVRRTENFVSAEYFIIDIDHLTDKGLAIDSVRAKLQTDLRVMLLFCSPSNDGLKVLFRLSAKCLDHGLYSIFYRRFVSEFSKQYGLEQVIDAHTCDVCRACFFSYDADAFFNADAESVDMNQYINTDNPFDMLATAHQVGNDRKTGNVSTPIHAECKTTDPDAEAIDKIKEILKLQRPTRPQKLIYVPEQLNVIIDGVKNYLEGHGLTVTEIIDISYGKKIRVRLTFKQAEVNLFYGKRGYSVVQSPRCGTDVDLNGMVADLVTCFLNQ